MKHISTNHGDVPTFACDQCAYIDTSEESLKHHKNLKHVKGRIQCEECNAWVRDASGLK